MPKTRITALLHTLDNQATLGRALDSLRSCDEVLVVDHGSSDETLRIARERGARIIQGVPGVDHGAYLRDAHNDWLLCLLPSESLDDHAETSLLEWKESEPEPGRLGYNLGLREQNGAGWKTLPAELRLVNREQINWTGDLPPRNPEAPRLQGEILRFADPPAAP